MQLQPLHQLLGVLRRLVQETRRAQGDAMAEELLRPSRCGMQRRGDHAHRAHLQRLQREMLLHPPFQQQGDSRGMVPLPEERVT